MLLETIKKSTDSEEILEGDVVCITDKGEAKKVSCLEDTFKVLGICSGSKITENDIQVSIDMAGISKANTNDGLLEPGDLVVAEVDGTVKCRTALEEDIDIIGMVIERPKDNKVLIKLK